ncbi:hypothetical protein B0T10DRAFT_490693 [Thelonectria olida]|uniref:Uncharacterized protein n=1 Tax=Thelonectria olida TaxID=1576542 RepID=A0A9P8W274_9HYPO|nr:hypothetical protein B0T10DRAFT_490693 [Thelonectria olida]
MASIPHGTTINAQCFNPAVTSPGAPSFPPVGITPIIIQGKTPRRFASQNIGDVDSRRLPQDLAEYEKAGTITQETLNNPNSTLLNANKGKNILEHTTFEVSTVPKAPELGGGTSNIGFNVGTDGGKINPATPARRSGNANAATTTAQYWISTIRAKIDLTPYSHSTVPSCPEKKPRIVSPVSLGPRDAVPRFTVDFTVPSPKTITVEYTQIQYSQMVVLDFNGLSWPHVSVATLAPNGQALSEVIAG